MARVEVNEQTLGQEILRYPLSTRNWIDMLCNGCVEIVFVEGGLAPSQYDMDLIS